MVHYGSSTACTMMSPHTTDVSAAGRLALPAFCPSSRGLFPNLSGLDRYQQQLMQGRAAASSTSPLAVRGSSSLGATARRRWDPRYLIGGTMGYWCFLVKLSRLYQTARLSLPRGVPSRQLHYCLSTSTFFPLDLTLHRHRPPLPPLSPPLRSVRRPAHTSIYYSRRFEGNAYCR